MVSNTLVRPKVSRGQMARPTQRPQPRADITLTQMAMAVEKAVARVNMFDKKGGQRVALGSCYVIDPKPANSSLAEVLIATCFHCVDQIGFLQGVFPGGRTCVLEPIAVNPIADCAIARVLECDLGELSPLMLPYDEAGKLIVRPKLSPMFAHGHPLGLQKDDEPCTSSGGRLTNRVPFVGPFGGECTDVIFTDAPINPGNSGGPLTDEFGMPNGTCSWGAGGDGLGFAPSIEWIIEILQKVQPNDHPYKGIAGATIVQSPYGPMVLVAEENSDLVDFQSSRPRSLTSRLKLGAAGFAENFRLSKLANENPEVSRRRRKALQEHLRVRRVPNRKGFAIIRQVNGYPVESVEDIRDALDDRTGRVNLTFECGLNAIANEKLGKMARVSARTCAEPELRHAC